MKKVCHLTSVHVRYDTRIFVKECSSLAALGYEVTLLVADGKGDELKNRINIVDIGKPSSRLKRLLSYHKKLLNKALSVKADIYHFHDPELLRIGTSLMRNGAKVIYDSHEDVPRQILDKAYIPNFLRKPLSRLIESYENKVITQISGVVTVTPTLESRFLTSNKNVVQVCNFPKIAEFKVSNEQNTIEKDNVVCYVGAISKVRGILSMVEAMSFTKGVKLLLGGKFENVELKNQAKRIKGWQNVRDLGFLSRNEVKETLQKSVAGLVVLEPTKSYVDSIPVKMFEYMMAGIPVIASDFPYWRELVGSLDCAIFVNPLKPKEISGAISQLIQDKELATAMGQRGKTAVLQKFNWGNEEEKLIHFYEHLQLLDSLKV